MATVTCAATGAPASIGVAKAPGEFRLDGFAIYGNATVFEGSKIETGNVRTEIRWAGGTKVTIGPESKVTVYRDHTVLESGLGVITSTGGHRFQASSLVISQASEGGVVEIAMNRPSEIVVAARIGAAQVRTASGILVAQLPAGRALAFDPQAGGASTVKVTGPLVFRDGRYFLTDCTTRVTAELRGDNLAQYVGKKLEVTGSPIPGVTPSTGASQVVQAVTIRALGKDETGGCAIPIPPGGGGAGAGAAGAGISAGAKVAIIVGVGVGVTTAGLYKAGVFTEDKPVSVR